MGKKQIHHLTNPGESKMLDYVVNIYQHGMFIKAIRYEGYSGHAVSDELKGIANEYPAKEGYTFQW